MDIASILLSGGVVTALAAIVVAAIKLGIAWLNTKTDELKEKVKSERFASAIDSATDAITTAVLQTAQIEAEAFKAAAEDGKLTDEEKAHLKDLAKERALSFLNNDVRELLIDNLGDFSAWLDGQVEAAVFNSKK